jgi:hypothetical protein
LFFYSIQFVTQGIHVLRNLFLNLLLSFFDFFPEGEKSSRGSTFCGEDGKEERIRRLPASDSYGIRPTKALKRRSAVGRVAGGAIGYQS